MNTGNRPSFANSIQNQLTQSQSFDSEESSVGPLNSSHDIKPTMHMILKQYIRESTHLGQVKTTFRHFSTIQLKEGLKRLSLQDKSSKKEEPKSEAKLALNMIQAVSSTKMGIRNYDNMENQDVLMQDIICENVRFYGIFDGHGQYGRDIALTAKSIFQNFLTKNIENFKFENTSDSKQSIFSKIIQKTNAYLLHYKALECEFSGTTAIIVAITKSTIYVFNIGNSRVVMGKEYKEDNKIGSFQITHDHTLERFDERLRITKTQAQISQYKNEKGEQFGPERIWAPKQKYPGITITRTLGLSSSYSLGVITKPQISVIEYNEDFKFLVMASDGLWRVFDNEEVVTIITKYYPDSLQGSANALMNESVKRWRDSKDLMDDVSLIIIPLIRQ